MVGVASMNRLKLPTIVSQASDGNSWPLSHLPSNILGLENLENLVLSKFPDIPNWSLDD